MCKMKQGLLLIGPDMSVRGVGGVTMHVQRLRQCLENAGFDHAFLDYKSVPVWRMLGEMRRFDLIHLNVSNPVLLFFLVLYCRLLSRKVMLTLHGNYGRFDLVKNWMVRQSLRMATIPVVINSESYAACRGFNDGMKLIPAFIPPQEDEALQDEVIALLGRLRAEGKTIVSTNASNVAYDASGNEIYGVDFLVRHFLDSEDSALIVSDPSGNYKRRYQDVVSQSVFFIGYPHPYYEVLKRVDCFVRNTSTDGDALSVKEAMNLGVKVLCTDVVDRPRGVSLFRYCDEASFEMAMKQAGNVACDVEDASVRLLQLYHEILS